MQEVKYDEALEISEKPSRISLAVSLDGRNNRSNIIALGWKMRTSFKPPMVAISVGKTRYSHDLIAMEKEFVLAFPGEDMGEEVLFCGSCSGREHDKFEESGLTPVESKNIEPALIKECPVNYECRVTGSIETGDHTIFVGEVVASYLSDEKRVLLAIGEGQGYDVMLEKSGRRFGVVRD